MIFDIGSLEFLVLIVLAILLFGPDKLPKLIQDSVRFLRKVREYSDNAKRDIRAELGPEFKDFEFDDLNPRKFAKKHLLDGDDLGLKELRDSLDVSKELNEVTDAVNGRTRPRPQLPEATADDAAAGTGSGAGAGTSGAPVDLGKDRPATSGTISLAKDGDAPRSPAAAPAREAPPFDLDAT